MIEGRYLVQDDSWKQYRTAHSIDTWIQSRIGFKMDAASEIDPLVKRLAESLGKGTSGSRTISKEEQKAMYRLSILAELAIVRLEKENNVCFDIKLPQIHLWLLDTLGRRLMSGVVDLLCVDQTKKIGLVLKHTFEPKGPLPAQQDRELLALALIASEALGLKEVKVGILNYSPFSRDFGSHTALRLQLFKQQLQKRLELIE